MKKIILYGPLAKKVSGGFDRMNANIVETFANDNEIKIYQLPMLKMPIRGILKLPLYPFFYFISFIYALDRLVYLKIKEKPDIFHITSVTTFLYRDVFILLFAKLLNIKIIFDIRAGIFIQNYQDCKKRFIYNLIFKISSINLVEGKKYLDFLSSNGFTAIYLPNFTHLKTLQAPKIYHPNKRINFIYVGRIVESKGISDSIFILKRLHEKYNLDLEFNLIGSFQEKFRAELDEKFGSFMARINFLGYMDKNEIENKLQNADFFMFLSKWVGEGHPNALNEAMSYGIPVFYYDQGFIREIINNDKFMVPNINFSTPNFSILDDCVNKIFKILNNPKLVNTEKLRLQSLIYQNYSIDKLYTKLHDIYLEQIE